MISEMSIIKAQLSDPTKATLTLEQIIGEEIKEFLSSESYQIKREAEEYYRNRSAIQEKTVLVGQRSNAKIEHPILKKFIDQKIAFLMSKPWTIDTENEDYAEALTELFDRHFRKKIKSLATEAIKTGIAWLQPYIDEGELKFLKIPSTELIPLWSDSEKSKLDGFIRFYDQTLYMGYQKQIITKAEYWDTDGVKHFTSKPRNFNMNYDLDLQPDPEREDESHIMINGEPYNWESPPLVWLRYNEEELPLNYFIKDFIDEINFQTSNTADLLSDVANFIYILKNYGGQSLDVFLTELREHRAIKITGDGGVDKLAADLDIQAVTTHLENQRRDVYEYASVVDTKDPELGNASGSAINFRYIDLINDCEDLGDELKDTFFLLKPFIDFYLAQIGKGDFSGEKFSVIFNMDMPVNETDIIMNIRNSEGIISKLSQIKQHPWIEDAEKELEAIEKEKKKAAEAFGTDLFGSNRFDEIEEDED